MKIFISTALCVILFSTIARGQNNTAWSNKKEMYIGLGLGLPYGGIGGRIAFNPSENIGTFIGLGSNFVGLGYNVGMMGYLPSKDRIQSYLSAMYGTNAAIFVDVPGRNFKEAYTGPSFGIGMLLKSNKKNGNYWDFGIILPIRNSDYQDDLDELESIGVDFTKPFPILVNIGFNINLN